MSHRTVIEFFCEYCEESTYYDKASLVPVNCPKCGWDSSVALRNCVRCGKKVAEDDDNITGSLRMIKRRDPDRRKQPHIHYEQTVDLPALCEECLHKVWDSLGRPAWSPECKHEV